MAPILAIWMLFLGLSQAQATTFVQQPFPQTVGEAPVIARGKIGRGVSDWVTFPDGQKRIYTFFELHDAEILKPPAESQNPGQKTLAIRELGGTKNGIGMQVAGAAQFAEGEDVVVFLNDRNADGSYDVRGMMMGKYQVHKQPDGQETLSGPGLAGGPAGSIVTDDAVDRAQAGPSGASPWTVDRLRQLIDTQKSNP